MPARSDISAADFDARLNSNPVWAAQANATKVEIANSVVQWICNLYNQAGKPNYRGDNLANPVVSVALGVRQRSTEAGVDNAGTTITFDSSYAAADDYISDARGWLTGDETTKVDVIVIQLTTGLTLIPLIAAGQTADIQWWAEEKTQ